MSIEIRELTPDLLDDYLHLFDSVVHERSDEDYGCYCVCWCSDDHRQGRDFSSPEKRRDLAKQYINSGVMRGYLAYRDGQVVGWCNANRKSECLHCIGWLRFMTAVSTTDCGSDSEVMSVFCFAVAPDVRRTGIATQLLERVCRDAADQGFSYVEAYPNRESVCVSRDFMGCVDMYRKCGFTMHEEAEHRIVMRKRVN